LLSRPFPPAHFKKGRGDGWQGVETTAVWGDA
jgi:hypothetical protein